MSSSATGILDNFRHMKDDPFLPEPDPDNWEPSQAYAHTPSPLPVHLLPYFAGGIFSCDAHVCNVTMRTHKSHTHTRTCTKIRTHTHTLTRTHIHTHTHTKTQIGSGANVAPNEETLGCSAGPL